MSVLKPSLQALSTAVQAVMVLVSPNIFQNATILWPRQLATEQSPFVNYGNDERCRFGADKRLSELGNTTETSFNNVSDSSMFYPITSGDAVLYSASGAQNEGNNSYYQNATQQLQVILLTGATNQILCQKVNKTDIMTSMAPTIVSSSYYGIAAAFGLIVLLTTL